MLESEDGIRLKAFELQDVVGKLVTCEDGVKRRVETIVPSYRYADKVLINEINEDETPGGAWVHVLSLGCQMTGKPLPTMEQKIAFSRMSNAMRFRPTETTAGSIILPSGLTAK